MSASSGLSVVIPNLNSSVIGEVLAALCRQDWLAPGFQVLVVGMDEPGLVADGGPVRMIPTERPVSPACARNIGWRACENDTVIFLDADCVPRPDWLAQMWAFRTDHPDAGAILGGMDFDSRNYWTACDQIAAFHEHMYWTRRPMRRASLPAYSLLVPRHVLAGVDGFDESFRRAAGEDLDLTIRIKRAGYNLYFNGRAVVIHRPRRSSWRDLWRHSYWSGHESIKVRLRYPEVYGMPGWARRSIAWRAFAAPIALAKTAQVLSASPARHARCAPFVFLAKFAWCLGAADTLAAGYADDARL